jgi:hypothetical protein
MHGPSTPAAYPVCGPSCASQAIAPAAISIPDATPRRTDCHGHQAASLRRPSDKLAALRDGQRRHERLSPVERRHATPVDDRLGRSRAEGAADPQGMVAGGVGGADAVVLDVAFSPHQASAAARELAAERE